MKNGECIHVDFDLMTKGKETNALIETFLKDVAATRPNLAKVLLTETKKRNIFINFNNSEAGPDGLYAVIVRGKADHVLIRLGIEHSFPRGFPILWLPGKWIRYFGFLPKFKNDERNQTLDNQKDFNTVTSIKFFKKWSGFLVHLLVWKMDNQFYWTVCSKNSASSASEFVQDAKRIFQPHITLKLAQALVEDNLHVCAEVMSQKDQCHGARVLKETPVVTVIGEGCQYSLDGSRKNRTHQGDAIIDFLPHGQVVAFCVDNNLPCDSATVIVGSEHCKEFLLRLSEKRDFLHDESFEELLLNTSGRGGCYGNNYT